MKITYWIIIVSGIILIAGWFYWFQFRPSEAIKTCFKQAVDKASQDCRNVNTGRENGGYDACVDKLGGYDSCLREKGIQ